MTRHLVGADGTLTDTNGVAVAVEVIDSIHLHVAHLAPHILTVVLPKGDRVNILVEYSCHCWTIIFDPNEHAGQMQIMDGTRPRAFCPQRFSASYVLPIYWKHCHRTSFTSRDPIAIAVLIMRQ